MARSPDAVTPTNVDSVPSYPDSQAGGLEAHSDDIDVYCESAPLADDEIAYGLSRALVPIIEAISPVMRSAYIYPVDGLVRARNISPSIKGRTILLSRTLALISRHKPATTASLQVPLLRIASALTMGSMPPAAASLFAVIGANYRALLRAASWARLRRQRLIVYMVDDLIVPLGAVGGAEAAVATRRIREALASAHAVFCITEALCERTTSVYNIESQPLNLAYSAPELGNKYDERRQIIHVGSVNILYLPAIKDLLSEIKEYNATYRSKIRVRFTIPRTHLEEKLGVLPDWIVSEPIPCRSNLLAEIAASQAAIVPYSFEPEAEVMVRTSFPSKFLDYLAAARRIIVYAPSYSSVHRYGRGLPEIEFISCAGDLIRLLSAPTGKSHQPQFRRLLQQRHSTEKFFADLTAGLRSVSQSVVS